jgi:hypothetical protein
MSRTWSPVLLVLVLACKGGDDGPADDTDAGVDDTDVADTDVASDDLLTGAWAVVDDQGGLDVLSYRNVGHLVFHDDLRFEIFSSNAADQRACDTDGWAPTGPGTLILRGSSDGPIETLLLVDRVADDTVRLTDLSGATLTLQREDAVPEDAQCPPVVLGEPLILDDHLDSWSNLVFDGTSLRLPTEAGAFAIDLVTGALSDPWDLGFTQYQLPVTFEDDAPWVDCGCGAVNELQHIQPGGTVLDEVVTDDVGGRLTVDGAAHDGTTLWLLGRDPDGRRHLRSVTTDGEPDTLVDDIPTELEAVALAIHQGTLYALDSHTISSVDTTTGKATATWSIPNDSEGTRWRGIASDGETLWIVSDADEHAVLAEVSLE